MIANIAGAAGGKQSVGQSMQGHVGIRMATELLVVRNKDAAERYTVSGHQLMHIVAVAGPDVRQQVRSEFFVGHGNVPAYGELDIVDGPFDQMNGKPRPFCNRGIVGEVVAAQCCGLVMGGANSREQKTLGRLRRIKSGASDRFVYQAIGSSALQRIGHGQGGQQPLMPLLKAFRNPLEQEVIDKGAGSIVDHHMGCLGGGQDFQSFMDGSLAGVAAEDGHDLRSRG
jgi:hypothetical protein